MTDEQPDAIRHLTTPDTINHEAEIGGRELTLTVTEATLGDLEAIDDDADGEEDAMRAVVDDYLQAVEGHDAPPADDIGMGKLFDLYYAIQSAWAGASMSDVREAMPIEGNGT